MGRQIQAEFRHPFVDIRVDGAFEAELELQVFDFAEGLIEGRDALFDGVQGADQGVVGLVVVNELADRAFAAAQLA